MASINFVKYHGAGNDFILIQDIESSFLDNHAHLIPELCHRNTGIGADGVLLLQPSQCADIKMRIFNQDGSEASMCGNGLRCVVHYLNKTCQIETLAGVSHGRVLGSWIEASLPKAEVIAPKLILDSSWKASLVNTGVPHLVIFVDEIQGPDLMMMAPKLRRDFDANVTFARWNGNQIQIRTYERGVERETLACGSGGAAAFLAHHFEGQITSPMEIVFASKEIATYNIDLQGKIWMRGNAKVIFSGSYTY